jgi:hypothetical protein
MGGCSPTDHRPKIEDTGLGSKSFSLECQAVPASESPQEPSVFKSKSFRLEQLKEKEIGRSENFQLEKQ